MSLYKLKLPSAMDTGWSRPMLQLVTDVYLLASHTTLWPSICGDLESTLLLDLIEKSTEQVKAVGLLATSLLQVGWRFVW